MSGDIFTGEWSGPSCPCEERGEWVSTCEAHPTNPEAAAVWLSELLRAWANQIAARFNAPVYLVGSALCEARPRDVDIRVVMPDDAFVARYGISATDPFLLGPDDGGEAVRLYWQDVAKLGAFCARHHAVSANDGRGLNIDFQVQSDAFDALYTAQGAQKNGARIRLDTLAVPVTPEAP